MKTALLHFTGNAAVLLGAWYWLGVPDRNAGYIALSAVLALAVVAGFVCLQCAALGSPLRRAHLVALWLIVIIEVPVLAGPIPGALWLIAVLPTAAAQKPVLPSPHYLLRAVPLVATGILLPWGLLAWTPPLKGLTAQSISFGLRLLLAYTLALAAWLLLARAAKAYGPYSRGRVPREA